MCLRLINWQFGEKRVSREKVELVILGLYCKKSEESELLEFFIRIILKLEVEYVNMDLIKHFMDTSFGVNCGKYELLHESIEFTPLKIIILDKLENLRICELSRSLYYSDLPLVEIKEMMNRRY